jgi:hypothetical protein
MIILNCKRIAKIFLTGLAALLLAPGCDVNPGSFGMTGQPPNLSENHCSVSGMVYFSTTPAEGFALKLIYITYYSLPDLTTKTSGGHYNFGPVSGGYIWIAQDGTSEFAMRPEILRVYGDVNMEDLYLFRELRVITPGYWETMNTSHPTITWHAVAEASIYKIDLHQNGQSIENGETRDAFYTISRELAPGNYAFRVIGCDGAGHIVADSDFSNVAATLYRDFKVAY